MNCVYTSAVACESLSQPLGRDAANVSFPRGISSVCCRGSNLKATTFFRAPSKRRKVHVRGRGEKQKTSGMTLKKLAGGKGQRCPEMDRSVSLTAHQNVSGRKSCRENTREECLRQKTAKTIGKQRNPARIWIQVCNYVNAATKVVETPGQTNWSYTL